MSDCGPTDSSTPRPAPKWVSARQLEANRRNASKSTGPRTASGKLIASRNALRHGGYAKIRPIDRGFFQEDPADLQAIVDDLVEVLQPTNKVERDQVLAIATAKVALLRFNAFEALELTHATTDGDATSVDKYEIIEDIGVLAVAAQILERAGDAPPAPSPSLIDTLSPDDLSLVLKATAMLDENLRPLHGSFDPSNPTGLQEVQQAVTASLGPNLVEAVARINDAACQLAERLPDAAVERAQAVKGLTSPRNLQRRHDQAGIQRRLTLKYDAELRRYNTLRQLGLSAESPEGAKRSHPTS